MGKRRLSYVDSADYSGELVDSITARLCSFPNVVVTSHQAFFTKQALAEIARVTLTNGDTETAYEDRESSVITVKGGVATIGYHGVIPKAVNIILYILFGVLLFGITTMLAYRMLVPPIRRERGANKRKPNSSVKKTDDAVGRKEPAWQRGDTPSYAPQQTTTFSIFELGILSRNKKYAEEIDRDVEERMNADRLEQRKKELRRKELEEMEKKVYGSNEQSEEKPAPERPRTQEMLDTLEQAMKAEPEAPAPTDPMELLDLVNGEDEDA